MAAAVCNMLRQMSLSLEMATKVTAINGQNLSIEDDFLQLTEKDIKTLCCVICQQGGAIAAGNVNQGISVLAMAKANLKGMIYNLRHATRCSWPIVWGDITLVRVQRLSMQGEMKASHKNPSTLPTI